MLSDVCALGNAADASLLPSVSGMSHVTLFHRHGDFPSTKADSAGSTRVGGIVMQLLVLIDIP